MEGAHFTKMTETVSQHSIPLEILDDLGSRFIINVPEEERKDLIRICFQIELAHWFYVDEYVKDGSKLKNCYFREFAEHMFRHISFLRVHADNVDQILEDWRDYKLAVPTYGAIILNHDLTKVLLVQGYNSRTSWGFPKGKVNEEEPPHLCAVREVYEETGYDIAQRIDSNDYLSQVINDQTSWLYLIHGVPDETEFAPRTKKEIRDIKWFPIASLPSSKKEEMPPQNDPRNPLNLTHNNLYMVIPFVRGLRKWLAGRQKAAKMNDTRQHTASVQGRGSRQGHNRSRQRGSASRSESFSSDTTNTNTSLEVGLTDNFIPKAWSSFRINRNEMISVIETTPGWIK